MENLDQKIISFILYPPFNTEWLFLLRLVFIIFALLLLVGTIIFLLRSTWLKYLILFDLSEFLTFRAYGVRRVEKAWLKTKARLETGLESEYKLAVLEADSMLDDILKRMGHTGESLGDRLNTLTSATLTNLEDLKTAHQTRNDIVHDPDFKLSLDEARRVLDIFEKAFRDLDAF